MKTKTLKKKARTQKRGVVSRRSKVRRPSLKLKDRVSWKDILLIGNILFTHKVEILDFLSKLWS